jgi:hypothetical protein
MHDGVESKGKRQDFVIETQYAKKQHGKQDMQKDEVDGVASRVALFVDGWREMAKVVGKRC